MVAPRLRALRCLLLLSAFVIFAAPAAGQDDPPGAYRASTPEPGPIETVMLEYINRCRANPAAEGERTFEDRNIPDTVDRAMYRREMSELSPAPPLVFDLRLIKASRWHSYYQTLHGQGHSEEAGKQGFTGASPGARIEAAGLRAGSGENVFLGQKDPWYCHLGFVVDWGTGPGGMQPARGHRRNIMDPEFRLAGVGAVPYEGDTQFATTHNLATARERFVGGVVLQDKNRNRFYDIGEGIGGVKLAVGEEQMASWFAGAFTLAIPTSDSLLVVELDGKRYAAMLPAGEENLKFDVFTSDLPLFARATALLAAYEKLETAGSETAKLGAAIDLHLAVQGTLVEESLLPRIEEITGEVRRQMEADRSEVELAVATAPLAAAQERVRAAVNTYGRTKARPWFAEAAMCLEIREGYEQMLKVRESSGSLSDSALRRMLSRQMETYGRITDPAWRVAALEWGKKTAALAPAPAGTQ